jgi:hypothetical protein
VAFVAGALDEAVGRPQAPLEAFHLEAVDILRSAARPLLSGIL